MDHCLVIERNFKRFSTESILKITVYAVEPPNKGHFGANSFVPCREVVPISEVK